MINSNLIYSIIYFEKIKQNRASIISQPTITKVAGRYYISMFVTPYTKDDIQSGVLDRPKSWLLLDIEDGKLLGEYDCATIDFSHAEHNKKYEVRSDSNYDTSSAYYDGAFHILDSVRRKIIETGKFYELEYKSYLNLILTNIPETYRRFYNDLSNYDNKSFIIPSYQTKGEIQPKQILERD